MTHKERFEWKWGKPFGYVLDELNRVRPGPTTHTVDYGELIDILCSSDASLLQQNSWIFSDLKYPKFLKKENESTSGKTVQN